MTLNAPRGFVAAAAVPLLVLCAEVAVGQELNERCTVSVLNRNVRVNPDGSWLLPNVPANFGPVRARVTCIVDDRTVSAESEPFVVPADGVVNVPRITFGPTTPIPTTLQLSAPVQALTDIGATVQLTVTARYPDGSSRDVSAASVGTQYNISNTQIATITTDGVVQAIRPGTVVVQAVHEGASGLIAIQVAFATSDTDGDGITDDVETSNGLDPNNAVDSQEDPDRDGLTNLQELAAGTDRLEADTDSDGLKDGDEITRGTNPLLRDTDGDGVTDGMEVSSGTDPLNPASVNLSQALSRIEVTPDNFRITVQSIFGVASRQLTVTGYLNDGSTIDLTATTRGTNYTSSNLNVCNFGATSGLIFGGSTGTCTITVTNSGRSASVSGVVTTFEPAALSSLAIPGYANNVDVNGNYAYVAAGSAGLQVVNVSNPKGPVIIGSVDTPGNANDVRIVGNLAYVADGFNGLQIIDVTNPAAPVIVGTVDTAGEANDVFVLGTTAFVADGAAGVQIISVIDPTAPLLLRTVDTPGTARGVVAAGTIAVVADDMPDTGVRVLDISNVLDASLIGNVALDGQPIDLDLSDNFAYVADYTGGLKVVNVANPASPVEVASLGGFIPRDVEVSGDFAIFAEELFANAVAPLVNVANPTTPQMLGVIDFGEDYNGTGIAVREGYVFWTGPAFAGPSENGVTGDTRLMIGQYLPTEAGTGSPPTVTIDSPVNGTQVMAGTGVTMRVTATDDVKVSRVTFLVNGQAVSSDVFAPYQYTLGIPVGTTSVVLGATASDGEGNLATAPNVTLVITPNLSTTVVGQFVDPSGNPIADAVVTAVGRSSSTEADGTFSIAEVSTILGSVFARAGNMLFTGSSAPVPPVPGGTTNVGVITAIARPAASLCSSAPVISTLPYSDLLDTTYAADQVEDPSAPGGGYNGVWYKLVVPSPTNRVTVTTLGSDYDTVISAWSGVCGSLTELASNDDFGDGSQSAITLDVTPGSTIYILASSYSGGGGPLRLHVLSEPVDIPANDTPAGAFEISASSSSQYFAIQNVKLATHDTNYSPGCYFPGAPGWSGVWYKVTPTANGRVQIRGRHSVYPFEGSSIGNTGVVISVWTGVPGSLTQLPNHCNSSDRAFHVAAGTTYYILFSAFYDPSVHGPGGMLAFSADVQYEFFNVATVPAGSIARFDGSFVWFYSAITGEPLARRLWSERSDGVVAVKDDGSFAHSAANGQRVEFYGADFQLVRSIGASSPTQELAPLGGAADDIGYLDTRRIESGFSRYYETSFGSVDGTRHVLTDGVPYSIAPDALLRFGGAVASRDGGTVYYTVSNQSFGFHYPYRIQRINADGTGGSTFATDSESRLVPVLTMANGDVIAVAFGYSGQTVFSGVAFPQQQIGTEIRRYDSAGNLLQSYPPPLSAHHSWWGLGAFQRALDEDSIWVILGSQLHGGDVIGRMRLSDGTMLTTIPVARSQGGSGYFILRADYAIGPSGVP